MPAANVWEGRMDMGEMQGLGCIICHRATQTGRPHGWTCSDHDNVEAPYIVRRNKIEAERRAQEESEKRDAKRNY